MNKKLRSTLSLVALLLLILIIGGIYIFTFLLFKVARFPTGKKS
ncbi:MAG: hypothetical protein P8Y81_15015 [Ignavibacteriaceae bacterium]